jgi:hypothetical protein
VKAVEEAGGSAVNIGDVCDLDGIGIYECARVLRAADSNPSVGSLQSGDAFATR